MSRRSEHLERFGYNLATLVERAQQMRQVYKTELTSGDHVFVKTSNSVYSILVTDDGCVVSGGWFDRKGVSPMKTRINGCTWGGSAIKVDIVAACGLCLEFGNRVVTTEIKKIFILPAGTEN